MSWSSNSENEEFFEDINNPGKDLAIQYEEEADYSRIINKYKAKDPINIAGMDIYFPHTPYQSQVSYMENVIKALNENCNAILESPTGTGKTLCLLCSVLGWLSTSKQKHQIFFATRTHAQIKSVIEELKKTCYTPRIAILSSRNNSCVNPEVKYLDSNERKNLKCHALRKISSENEKTGEKQKKGCIYYENTSKGIFYKEAIYDIEDLAKFGSKEEFCPFYNERKKAKDSDLIFMPYSYICNPSIRDSVEVNLSNGIVIFDEAHNILSECEKVGEISITTSQIIQAIEEGKKLQKTLKKKSSLNNISKLDNEGKLDSAIFYLEKIKENFEKVQVDGERIGERLIKGKKFEIDGLKELFSGKTEISLPDAPEIYRSGQDLIKTIEQINDILKKIVIIGLGEEAEVKDSFLFYLSEEVASDGKSYKELSTYCFNPGFYFKEISDQYPLSILLTSGTLPNPKILEEELKAEFKVQLKNNHEIKEDQVYFTSISAINYRKDKKPETMDFTKNSKENPRMILALGSFILTCCQNVPGGVLTFFGSFRFMQYCIDEWKKIQYPSNTSIYNEIRKEKKIFQDSRGGTSEGTLEEFNSISKKGEGAILFSVFRSSNSEGVSFSDDAARLAILIGIPYPYLLDKKTYFKKEILKSKGEEWYKGEAMTAINQSIGRVFRHKNDYGAIICIDKKYNDIKIRKEFSKWISKYYKNIQNSNSVLIGLKQFFEKHRKRAQNFQVLSSAAFNNTQYLQRKRPQG